ncbi:MAG: protein-L-isoaspartate(D-aspartate) O-methyltransferase [Myxococcota bacterium]
MANSTDLAERRRRMVQNQIEARGITDKRVLEAMRSVPREQFVPAEMRERAYTDGPLPIGTGQTISQPYIVALMAEALELEPGDRVLEVGTGSGYAAAVLGELAEQVFTVERHAELAERATAALDQLGYENVHVMHGDGTVGWEDEAPFDAIVSAAAGPSVPDSLKSQLAIGGRLVMPVGDKVMHQSLVRVRREAEDEFASEDLGAVRFVPLIGEEGFSA